MDTDYEDKYSKKADWKRLGKLVLAVIGLILLFIFLMSYFSEIDEQEKNADISDDEIEILKDINE